MQEILYTWLFSPRVIFVHLHSLTVSHHLQFAKTESFLKKDNMRHWNFPSLKFTPPAGNEGENKMGVNISLYTVFATMRLWSQTSLLNVCTNNTGVDKAFRLKNSCCSKFSPANGGKKVANEINRFTVNVFVFLDIIPNFYKYI